ncbi:glycosyltransferase family 2 protein [Actinobacillus minor]|uniref:glycosyltransferase family 2 protein n=1 Tax=Actinobacillus minor TaxID=51047 RepID=UPI0023EFD798|nr:glycosyltransferase family A protein [Actinobacillus minor]MDD6911480.1 glycosyltransferase family A protein [Actinobacillus minor]MDY4712422.1 glycosyltransferase family A protein [Actinobacillus minor]
MKLSIIITLYNRADKVVKALESVLSQTYSQYEIVIVDDGSSDSPEIILAPYLKQNNIKYIKQENMGAAGAKNRGAKEATGEFIFFLDSDDWLEDEFVLEKIVTELTDNIDFVTFNQIRVITDQGQKINTYQPESDLHTEILRYPLNYAACPPYIFRRHLFLEIGGFDLQFKWGDALLFWRKFLPRAKIKICDGIGYVYDQRGEDSVSRKKDARYLENVFITLNASYLALRKTLIEKGFNKEWELVLLGVALKKKDWRVFFTYFLRLFSNNFTRIPTAVYYLITKRMKK